MSRVALSASQKFEKFAVQGNDDECWEWNGYKNPGGYALIRFSKYNIRAHRYAFETYIGPIPEGLVLDHICRNRGCVNPHHVRPMTRVENMLIGTRSNQNKGKTHCIRGHEFTPENTIVSNGKRGCRICKIEYSRRVYRMSRL